MRHVLFIATSTLALLVAGIGHAALPKAANREQRLALRIIRELDMTTFPSSIGPRREPGKHTLADYGFTEVSLTPHGAELKEADGQWAMGFRIILATPSLEDPSFINLCWTDRATNGGTYRWQGVLAVFPTRTGYWRGSTRTSGFPDCLGATVIIR